MDPVNIIMIVVAGLVVLFFWPLMLTGLVCYALSQLGILGIIAAIYVGFVGLAGQIPWFNALVGR